MPVPQILTDFDIAGSGVTVWLFKKSGGVGGAAPTFTGRWITIDAPVEDALKQAFMEARASIEEVNAYGILTQNNEGSALSISTIETHADLIIAQTANALPQRKVRNVKDVQNTKFYVVRMTSGASVLHAVRKTDASWSGRRRSGFIDVMFRDEALELDAAPQFSISRHVDFFIIDDTILIKDKGHFESILSHRQAHVDDFAALRTEALFVALFTDLAPLVDYVGSNRIQLRRVCAIRQKGHYLDQGFIGRLRQHHAQYGLNLQFDANGRIAPTEGTCADIITALLDHRLSSAFSQIVYDVPDATQVN